MLAVYRPLHTRIFQEATATYDYFLYAFNKPGVKGWLFRYFLGPIGKRPMRLVQNQFFQQLSSLHSSVGLFKQKKLLINLG